MAREIHFNNLNRYLTLCFIGFANALPLPLLGSTLTIWLSECGFTNHAIGFFALLGIPFSFKIFWTPIVDLIPILPRANRKGWLLFSLYGLSLCLLSLSYISPCRSPFALAICLSCLSLFTGCIYIVGVSYEIESLEEENYGVGSAYVITGYRLGLLIAGAGALYLSDTFGWAFMYQCLAGLLAVGSLLIIFQKEPVKSEAIIEEKKMKFSRYSSIFQGFWHENIKSPLQSLYENPRWLSLLCLLLTFKFGDHIAKIMAGPFYLSLGFAKSDLATAAKLWGMIATILGAFTAGFFIKNKDSFKTLAVVGFIHACSLSCYYLLALVGKSFFYLCLTVAIENFTGGMAMSAFTVFLWKVCDKRYAAVQYSLLWSLFSFKADIVACLGGIIAAYCSWPTFFLAVACAGIASSLAVISQLRKLSPARITSDLI